MLEHSFYGYQWGKTVILIQDDLTYSEAFAGSGESYVTIMVEAIMNAKSKSLILLDEPETSLHPGAQSRLKHFLLQQIIENKHQIVVSTHSPTLIEGLPSEAIKVMFMQNNGVGVKPSSLPQEAFYVIGYNDVNKLHIFVEDKLTRYLIERYIKRYRPELSNSIHIGEFCIIAKLRSLKQRIRP